MKKVIIIEDSPTFCNMLGKKLEATLLSQVLDHIRQRAGKRMRPILILLMARNFGKVSSVTQHSGAISSTLHISTFPT